MSTTKNVIDSGQVRASSAEDVPLSARVAVDTALGQVIKGVLKLSNKTGEASWGPGPNNTCVIEGRRTRAIYITHAPLDGVARLFRSVTPQSHKLTSTYVREVIRDDRDWLVPLLRDHVPGGRAVLDAERPGATVQQAPTPAATPAPAPPSARSSDPSAGPKLQVEESIIVRRRCTVTLKVADIVKLMGLATGGTATAPMSRGDGVYVESGMLRLNANIQSALEAYGFYQVSTSAQDLKYTAEVVDGEPAVIATWTEQTAKDTVREVEASS